MIVLQIMYVFVMMAVPILVALLVAIRMYQPEPKKKRKKRMTTEQLLTPSGGYWQIDLVNIVNGQVFRKVFRQRLVLGRTVNDFDVTGTLSIGSESYISREQCALFVTREGVVLRNLSVSNATMLNGQRMDERPCYVRSGDEIGIGYSRYRIMNLAHIPVG